MLFRRAAEHAVSLVLWSTWASVYVIFDMQHAGAEASIELIGWIQYSYRGKSNDSLVICLSHLFFGHPQRGLHGQIV